MYHDSVQESRAIAKMTARCALYMDALKTFGSPWLRQRLLLPKAVMGFCQWRNNGVGRVGRVQGAPSVRGPRVPGKKIPLHSVRRERKSFDN